MKKARKDNKGRALRVGEYQRYDRTYEYRYTDPFGKQRGIYADTLQELRKKEELLLKDQLDGLDIYSDGNATVNFLFDRYIKMKTNLRPSTLANYKYMYNKFVRDSFGKKKIIEVKYSDVLQFYNHLVNDCGLKLETLDNVHTTLHPAFQLAVRDNVIRKNPTDGVIATMKKGRSRVKTTRHALTLEQQRSFMNYIAESPFFCQWLPLFTVLLGTGMRVGEMVGLRWEDLDFKNKMISVNHSLTYYPQDGSLTRACAFRVSLPKTEAGIRSIPMFPQVEAAFLEIKKQNQEEGMVSETIDGMTDFIFLTANNRVITPRQINDVIERITKACNEAEAVKAKSEEREAVVVPHFSCHHLRHTFCTRFCETETNVKVIQAIMGHANIATTMDIYTDVNEAKKTEAMLNLAMSVDVF